VEAGRRPRRGNTSSTTAAGGETSKQCYGSRWERRRAGKGAGADTCRSPSCFPERSVIKQWWTSWRLLKSGSSRPNEWREGAGKDADSIAGSSSSGHISFLFLFLSFYFGLSLSFHLSVGMKGSREELRHLAGYPGGGGEIRSCHTLLRVHTVCVNNNNNNEEKERKRMYRSP